MSARVTRLLWILLGLTATGLAGLAVQRAWPLLHPSVTALADRDPGCDLRAGACRARFADGGAVTFELEPRQIPVLTPLTLQVAVTGMAAHEVQVDFAGVDMDMGFNRVRLQEVQPGRYAGQAILPVCVRTSMRWEARVLILTDRGLVAAPFRFETRSR